MIGSQELLVILAIILLLFGANKLPELARSLGKAKREFKKGMEEEEKEKKDEITKIAENLGIDTEGKSKEEILKEISSKLEAQKKE